MKHPVYYDAPNSLQCDICNSRIDRLFADGKTSVAGLWAVMCPSCYATHGVGLGIGRGQRYERQADGRYLKTGG